MKKPAGTSPKVVVFHCKRLAPPGPIIMMCNTQDVPNLLEQLVDLGRSDSANLDAVFELMTKSRHRAPCDLMSLVPTAYENEPALADNPEIVDFYKFHGDLLEAWDGPALLVYSDGKSIGASLDRNGLRPARYSITKDGTVYMMSETLPCPPSSMPVCPGKWVFRKRTPPSYQTVCVTLRVDGGIRTGRDLAIAAMMGAEEFGFGTIAMIAEGCVMARVCHLNTCPVGVTSQKEELRKKFPGTPEHVVNFFEFVAEEIRELMTHLGYSKFEDLIGRADLLKEDDSQLGRIAKTKGVSLSGFFGSIPDSKADRAFLRATPGEGGGIKGDVVHVNGFSSHLDREICDHPDVKAAIEKNEGDTAVSFNIKNTDRRPAPCWRETLHESTLTRVLTET